MENQITFVSADEGNLEFYTGRIGDANTEKKTAATIEEAAKIIQEHNGFAERAFFSSSMDFASEYGFADDGDAHAMLESAVAVAYA